MIQFIYVEKSKAGPQTVSQAKQTTEETYLE